MFARNKAWVSIACLLVMLGGLLVFAHHNSQPVQSQFWWDDWYFQYLPVMVRWEVPPTPVLQPIDNADMDANYTVNWSFSDATEIVVQEATRPDFSDAQAVIGGTSVTWTPPVGKFPGTYYYRVAAMNAVAQSAWSNVQTVTVYPLFVGLQARWDGTGYIRGSVYYDVGRHVTRQCMTLTEPDTLRCYYHSWYAPNPEGWPESTDNVYYSPTTGAWRASSTPGDPSWKWGAPWMMGYHEQFTNGQTVTIDGQKFTTTGPFEARTTYGRTIQLWQFINQSKFLYWHGGGDWTQYIHPGDAVLWYDAGGSKLLVYSGIKRTEYYQGRQTSDTIQYIMQLSSSTSLPGSPPFVSNAPALDGDALEPSVTIPLDRHSDIFWR